ncbi:MAG: hypothetical protein COB67_05535 [SAR324 cluster bacterium]|uniref:LruC domain-containing protein n=1 Tax=SAR324 cluster bacterium TaxID=2024889 RepID=A0A2A4T5M7_9DELT|nr:MAG: hypothetical protein COB67_05535 [SAR324 cluster bacterium]
MFRKIFLGLFFCIFTMSVSGENHQEWQLNLSNFDGSGKPLNLVTPPVFSSDFYSDLVAALPEMNNMVYLHPEYFTVENTTINLLHNANEVKVTFLHEGAGYRNMLGYVAYQNGNEPQTVADLKANGVFLFPNASLSGSGGSLSFGDTVSLGDFPQNTKLLFFIVSNGWNNGSIQDTDWIFTTDMTVNPEDPTIKMNNIPITQHVAMLWHSDSKLLVMGFEDIFRTGGDHDFNDVMFTVSSTPSDAIQSTNFVVMPEAGESNNQSHHYSPAMDTLGILAYEDLWPQKGDFDFNDVVVNYYIIETREDNKVIKVQYDMIPQAMGASFSNSFRLRWDVPISKIKSVKKTFKSEIWNMTAREDNGGSIIEFIDSVKGAILPPSGYKMSNTIAGSPLVLGEKVTMIIEFTEPISPSTLGDPPYNSYIARGDGLGGLIEVHLPNQAPSSEATLSYFGTGDDDSIPNEGRYYKTSGNLPWAISIPNPWNNPLEKTTIHQGYPLIVPWAASNGVDNDNWYQAGVDNTYLYLR